jgi:hypothetical protein
MKSNREKLSFIRDHYIDKIIGKELCPHVTNVRYTNNPVAVISDHFFCKATKHSMLFVCFANLVSPRMHLSLSLSR